VWLSAVDGKIVPNELTATVQEMYRLASLGTGVDTICHTLKNRLIAPRRPDRTLSRGWVVLTLQNRAVLGESRHWKTDEVIPDFFPQVIEQSLFDEVRQSVTSRTRGKKYRGGFKKLGMDARNLFTGLVYDVSGGTERIMHFKPVQKWLYLQSDFRPDLKMNRIRYDKFLMASTGTLLPVRQRVRSSNLHKPSWK
jgi:hypothetical protein